MKKIVKVKIFNNDNELSINTALDVVEKLNNHGFEIVEEEYDLAIAIGGDGSFLRMLKKTNFNSDAFYIGINTGTLGFLQEIKPNEIENFIEKLVKEEYRVEEIGIQETIIDHKDGNSRFFSLNEILVREQELNSAILEIFVGDNLLEKFVGDGIMISTSVGSTAYNLSYGGSIVYNSFHTLQITPIAPLNNKAYRNLINSVILPEAYAITLIPKNEKRNILLSVDGDNYKYHDVSKIVTTVKSKRIKCLRLEDYDFIKIINDKFLKTD